jgi:hypothetical protein
MKQIFYLVIASILIAGIIVVAIPNTAQAISPNLWCFRDSGFALECFVKLKECKAEQQTSPLSGSCTKQPAP